MIPCDDKVYYHMSEFEGKVKNWGCRLNVVRYYYARCPPPKRFLEIGVKRGLTCTCLSDLIRLGGGRYTGVECRPHPHQTPLPDDVCGYIEHQRSIDFWRETKDRWECIYVDGGHDAETAALDVQNAMARIEPGGYIIVHDVANEKFPEDGPRRAFRLFFPHTDVYELELVWHDQGWMGVAHRRKA